jgi:hypothetical protein
MGDDHALAGNVGRNGLQPLGDEFVGEAVKSVAAHALRVEPLRNRIIVRNRAVTAVKRRDACHHEQSADLPDRRTDARRAASAAEG